MGVTGVNIKSDNAVEIEDIFVDAKVKKTDVDELKWTREKH